MIEYIKHLLGLCGEPHGLIFTLKSLFTIGGLLLVINYIKTKKDLWM
jgi:hypothetical protein